MLFSTTLLDNNPNSSYTSRLSCDTHYADLGPQTRFVHYDTLCKTAIHFLVLVLGTEYLFTHSNTRKHARISAVTTDKWEFEMATNKGRGPFFTNYTLTTGSRRRAVRYLHIMRISKMQQCAGRRTHSEKAPGVFHTVGPRRGAHQQ